MLSHWVGEVPRISCPQAIIKSSIPELNSPHVIIDLPGTIRHVGRQKQEKIHREIRYLRQSGSKVSKLARKRGGSLGSGLCHKESLVPCRSPPSRP